MSSNNNASMENVKAQLSNYGGQIQDFLSGVKADIQQYKFLVEKTENGIAVDIEFKATISAETNEGEKPTTVTGRESTSSTMSNP